jgi:hypothetical protein
VREVASKEYVATFPNKLILDTFARSNGFELALYKISVTVSPTTISPGVSSVLQEGWVQMFNVPDEAKGVEAVTAIAKRAGEVIVVDEVSLIKVGPVRVKIRARDISKIKGYLEVFIEGEGHDIKFEPEIPTKKGTARQEPSSKDDKPSDGDYADDEADDLSEFEEEQTKEGLGEQNQVQHQDTMHIGRKTTCASTGGRRERRAEQWRCWGDNSTTHSYI